MDILHGQQLIRRLGRRHPVHWVVYGRQNNAGSVGLGFLHDLVAGDGLAQINFKETPHLGGVGPRPAEESGGVKGPAARPGGEVFAVQHDACHQGLRLQPKKLVGFQQILQKLGGQFRCRGGVRFVIVQRSPLYIAGRPAVVVNDRHFVDRFQKLLTQYLFGPIGIHHHQKGVGVGGHHGVGGGEECVFIFRQGRQLGDHLCGGACLPIMDDVGGHPHLTGHGQNTRRRPHTVQIGELVAHDKNPGGVCDEALQSVGHHPAFYLGVFFRVCGPAAEELKVEPVLHHRLVAAPG